jgi:hypothetical protein
MVSFYWSVICVTILFKLGEDAYYSAWDHHILKFREVEISLTPMPCALDLKHNLLLFFVMFENCKLKFGNIYQNVAQPNNTLFLSLYTQSQPGWDLLCTVKPEAMGFAT